MTDPRPIDPTLDPNRELFQVQSELVDGSGAPNEAAGTFAAPPATASAASRR